MRVPGASRRSRHREDLTTAQTPGDTLAHIGSVFNAAANVAIGGVNTTNLPEFQADIQAVATGIQNILNSPTQLAQIETGESGSAASLTTIHLQTVENELQASAELRRRPVPDRSEQGGARNQRQSARHHRHCAERRESEYGRAVGNGTPATTGGFGEQPAYLSGTITHYQDNQAETSFWQFHARQCPWLGSRQCGYASRGWNTRGEFGPGTEFDLRYPYVCAGCGRFRPECRRHFRRALRQ